MKEKVVAILLLLCMVAPVVSTLTFLEFQKKQIKHQVKQKIISGIDKNELVLLKFTKAASQSSLKWEHSKEFEYKGQMYDVVEKLVKGDTIFYWCWLDHKETKLNKRLDEILAKILRNNPKRQEKESQLADFFKKLFHENQKNQLTAIPKKNKKYFGHTENFKSIYHSTPFPPPRYS